MYRSLISNEQFLADGFTMLKGKTNLGKLENKLADITSDYTQDFFEVTWHTDYKGHRIV